MKWINRFYILFVGIILTITTGFGVAAFYPEPVHPQYPQTAPRAHITPQSCYATPQTSQSVECQKYFKEDQELSKDDLERARKYEQEEKAFRNKNAGYTRTAIFFGISVGALFAIIGLSMIRKSKLLSTGFLLAGVLTAVLTRFIISLASLGAAVTGTEASSGVGYIEFGILLALSVSVIFAGFFYLADEYTSKNS